MLESLHEFRLGWKIILGAIIGVGSGLTGIVFYTHGVFIVPIIQETGWSRGSAQFAFSFVMITAVLTAPLVGYLTDKYGARKLALISLVALSITFASLSMTTNNIYFYYMLWFVMSVLAAGTFPVTWTRGINNLFDKNRGLALGLTMMGTGLVALAGPIYAASLIEDYGWRGAYRYIGLTILLFSFPLVFFFFKEDNIGVSNNSKAPAKVNPYGLEVTLQQAVKDYRFWALGLGLLFVCYGVAGLITNLVPLLLDKGYGYKEAAKYAGLIGVMVIIGRLLVGYLIDRLPARKVAFVFLILPALSCILLSQSIPGAGSVVIASLIIGLAAGAELDLIAYMTSRYFGMKHYGRIYGAQFIFFAIGSGGAPAIFGWSNDYTGTYDFILYSTAFLFVIGASMILTMGDYSAIESE
ncbi:MAG: hypothetical protein CMM25_09135 [Rhodospirillaceae bacterium]|nr:hypothetical protein [Rhodospirillaceae bacterium]